MWPKNEWKCVPHQMLQHNTLRTGQTNLVAVLITTKITRNIKKKVVKRKTYRPRMT